MATRSLDELMHHLRANALKQDGGGLADGELLECFVVFHDDAAFEALVRRHGPMVYGACRRILGNDADAEDAFQATFLVLVRKAASIRPRGMVSNWLYGVAHNTAIKAKAMNHQRQRKEREAGTMPKAGQSEEVWSQMQSLVDTELSRLPDKYRVPIVLCDLEGKTIKEAGHHLGWPQGTVASRLTRGRALLARRLSKHGLHLSAGLIAGALCQGAATASVPASLTASTIQAGCLMAAGKAATASGISAAALALTDGVLKTMLLAKLKVAAAAVLVTALLTAGIGAVHCKWLGGDGPICCPSSQSAQAPEASEPAGDACRPCQSTPALAEAPPEDANPGPAPMPTKIYIFRTHELNSSDPHGHAIPDLYAMKAPQAVKAHKIEVRRTPNGAAPADLPAAAPDSKPKAPQPFIALIHTWSSERLTLVVHKGKYYLIGPLGADGRPLNGQPIRFGPVSWRLNPDGTKLLVIGSLNDRHFSLSIRGLHLGKTDPTENGSAGHAVILPTEAAGAGSFHSAP